jgi:hypothetical protein
MTRYANKPLPSRERVLERFKFFPATGALVCRKTNEIAGSARKSGHRYVCIDGVHYGVHRLIYMLAYGVDPGDKMVDHIDRDATNNRPSNLRLATLLQNTCNVDGARSDSSTGARGVRWREKDRFWYVTVGVGGKKIHVGCFKSKDEAIAASKAARERHFGEFCGSV